MPTLFAHRVNTIEALQKVPETLGIEFDLRSDGDRVIVTHDPFTEGPTIEEFFPHVGPRPCIFNVKCEGIEARVLAEAAKAKITEFFFLDLSIPAAVKLWRQGETRIAVRYSELEPFEGVLAWAGRATWAWVDCFEAWPADPAAWARVAERFKVCLVSPELQGHGTDAIARFRAGLGARRWDAACTKRPDLWSSP
jgi:hypothetical protein